jgi:CBS-domain-containing membrane protein
MLTSDLINHNIPQLQLKDSIGKAKMLMNDFKLTHLPVVKEKKLIGLISEDDLLDLDEDQAPLENIRDLISLIFIPDDVHFMNAVSFCNQHETNVLPVIDKHTDFIGVITAIDLLKALGDFAGANEIGGLIILELEPIHFSISEISRIVESNNATVLHLNSTIHPQTGIMQVTIHLNKKELDAVVATFERYEYKVIHAFGEKRFEDNSLYNYKNLMNYLDL